MGTTTSSALAWPEVGGIEDFVPHTKPNHSVGTRPWPNSIDPVDQSILALQHEVCLEVEPAGNRRLAYRCIKRSIDVLGASAALILLSPLLLTVLLVLTVTTRGKPIFSQERIGFRGRRFRMWKFRSMRLDADQMQHLVKNEAEGPVFKNRRDPRITRVGRLIRATSIDEMPQLINVLAGQMSLVGPRPLPVKEVAKQSPAQRRRHAVTPGLTCLWQVSGRSKIGYEDWMRMDLWYVENQSLITDAKLLIRTPLTVLSCNGAY